MEDTDTDREKMTEEEMHEAIRIMETPWRIAKNEEEALRELEKKVWKVAEEKSYSEANKTTEWWIAKNILFSQEKRKSGIVECWRCGEPLDFYSSVMHHWTYEGDLFDLENIEFVCWDCHKAIHNG